MYKLFQLIEEHKETLATIETWDNGTLPTIFISNQDLALSDPFQANPTPWR